ncbi:glycine cleavage system aminomethyltransferase GcvT [Rhodosalinus sediminis]|uniref:aminomethyltransferase n=1 Tax=Rhodosalinus sediminis TaxID=1940533 RepID=A0A3D9BYU5_9RHOB|nr:glycine cleavage system aminomethyltransferase GcvT [Rhodosalinus sediminis]REC58707.1 glycine cleavage system aminomethyltransferase GcvT [Rhodosalinus sediminis]
MAPLDRLPLDALHRALGAKMGAFAGVEMPMQYAGVMDEHRHARTRAALFDVSHMGQVVLDAPADTAAAALEALVPQDIAGLKAGRQRYAFFTNAEGGIEDDLMIADYGGQIRLVINAARREADMALLRAGLPADVPARLLSDRALLALQGPEAEAALAPLAPEGAAMRFMDVAEMEVAGVPAWISRSGYTGEDGYEISLPADRADAVARALLDRPEVAPAGLGARDTLRLEAGLCLYGQDIDSTTSPIEAGLGWAIQKARRAGGAREGGFPGAARILREMAEGAPRARVGLRPAGRAPMRAGVPLYEGESGGAPVGTVTSGGFGPTVGAPVAMGYVPAAAARQGHEIFGEVRGKRLAATVSDLPFVPARTKR